MNFKELYNMNDMLKGNVNRMFLCDSLEELLTMRAYAKMRIDLIFNGNYMRLKEKEKEKTEDNYIILQDI